MTRPDAVDAHSLDLLRWVGWAQQKAGEDWIRERDLTHSQAFALGHLVRNPGAIQRDIAETTRTSAANVSMLLQGLERRGLLERRADAGNDRVKRVHPTDAGRALIAGFDDAMHGAYDSILAPLDDAERDALHALLLKVVEQLPEPTRT